MKTPPAGFSISSFTPVRSMKKALFGLVLRPFRSLAATSILVYLCELDGDITMSQAAHVSPQRLRQSGGSSSYMNLPNNNPPRPVDFSSAAQWSSFSRASQYAAIPSLNLHDSRKPKDTPNPESAPEAEVIQETPQHTPDFLRFIEQDEHESEPLHEEPSSLPHHPPTRNGSSSAEDPHHSADQHSDVEEHEHAPRPPLAASFAAFMQIDTDIPEQRDRSDNPRSTTPNHEAADNPWPAPANRETILFQQEVPLSTLPEEEVPKDLPGTKISEVIQRVEAVESPASEQQLPTKPQGDPVETTPAAREDPSSPATAQQQDK